MTRLSLAFGLLVAWNAPAFAGVSPQGDTASPWPTQWSTYRLATGDPILDVLGDENPNNADLSSGPCSGTGCSGTSPTVYYASDGTTAFFRVRLAVDPSDATKGGLTGNAYLTQIAVNGTVVAVAGVDGKSASVDYVYVASAPGTTVTQIYTWPFTSPSDGMRVVSDGAGQWFLDYQVPISRLTAISGGAITSSTGIQLYYGSSAAANLATLNKDLMRGSTSTVSFTGLAVISLSPSTLSATSSATHTSGPALTEGQTSRYTITLTATNSGGGELSNATATATLPAGVTYVSGGTGVSASGSTVTWNAGLLLPGETDTRTFVVDVTPASGTAGTNVPLLSAVSVTGTDVGTSSPRTASAPALTVGPVAAAPPPNVAPVAGDDTLTAAEDGTGSVNVLTNDSDGNGDALTVTVTGAPAHGTTSVSGGVVTYTPSPNYSGPDSFTYTVCDPSGACDTADVTVTVTAVNDAPSGLANTGFTTPEDTPHNGTLPTATDVDGDALTYSAATQPAHGSVVVNADGTFTYTPDPNYAGADSFTYRACDPFAACATATATVTVTPMNDPPGPLAGTSFSTPEDTAYDGTLPTSTDPDGETVTYAALTQPDHGTVVVDADGTFTYTPDANYSGPDSFTYQACDAASLCASATTTVTVTPVNDPPGPLAGTSFSTPEDTGHSGTLPAGSDPDGDALTYSAVTQPAHGTVVVNGDGTYTYTPDPNYHGPDSFTYQVCDPAPLCSSATATVTVTAVNDAPAALAGTSFTTPEDTAHNGMLPAGSDPDGDALTYSAVTQPDHGTVVVNADGTYTYTPDANYHGPDSFTYQVCDPAPLCSSATATVTVSPVNDAPAPLASTSFSTPEDTAHNGTLPPGSDPDGDALTYSAVTQPSHGTVTVNADGTYTYTPDANYNGPDSFTYQVCDPAPVCAGATATVTVSPVNDAPAPLASTSFTTQEDTAHNGTLPAGNDPDGDALTYSAVTQPAHGTVTVNADGTYTYTPDANYTGPDSFTYQVCDPAPVCASATATVTVSPVNDPPGPLAGTSFSTPEDTAHNGTLPAGSDPDGDALTYSVLTPPAHGTVVVNADGTYTYTPAPNYDGGDSFVYRVCDPSDACSTATATVTVTPVVDPPVNVAPVAVDDVVTTTFGTSVPIDVLDNDVDTDTLTVTTTTTPAHGTVTIGTGGVTYVPDSGFSGTDTFDYTVCDPSDACDTATVTVTVLAAPPVNQPPVAHAGPDSTADKGAVATLNGSGSSDPDGDTLTYVWTQVSGPPVVLSGASTVAPTFTPTVPGTYVFQLSVSDGSATDTDTVTITVPLLVVDFPPPVCDDVTITNTGNAVGVDLGCEGVTDGATVVVVGGPAHGDAEVLDDGTINYTPDAGWTGPDAFTVRVCNGDACEDVLVTVLKRTVARPSRLPSTGGGAVELLAPLGFVLLLAGVTAQRRGARA